MEFIIYIIEKSLLSAVAALGFAILFNVPQRALKAVAILAIIGGGLKFTGLHFHVHIVISTLLGAIAIGAFIVPWAHKVHTPPIVFSIPAVIPMVPGAFAYRMMLGLIRLTDYNEVDPGLIGKTINSGLNMIFILTALAIGVSVPILLSRKQSVKHMKLIKRHS